MVHRKRSRGESYSLNVFGTAYHAKSGKSGLEKEFCCTNVTIRHAGWPWIGVWFEATRTELVAHWLRWNFGIEHS
jgi:hypothetical protein